MYKIFIFSRRTSWNVTFFLEARFKGSKSSSKMGKIEKFEKSKNLSKRFAKIWALKWFSFEDLVEPIILHPSLLVEGIWKVD